MIFNKADLKYTLRLLAKKPGLTLLSVIVLAGGLSLSILAVTALYTLIYKAVPLGNSEAIFRICAGEKSQGCRPFKAFEFAEMRGEITALENVGVYTAESLNVETEGLFVAAQVVRTEWNMFQLSRSNAILGRTLQAYDHEVGAEPVAVLGYKLWQTAFKGDVGVIGSTLNLQGAPVRIVGVMPQGYKFPRNAQLWLPITPSMLKPLENGQVPVNAYALLKADASVAEADRELANFMTRTRALYPAREPVEELDRFDTGHISTLPAADFDGAAMAVIYVAVNFLAGSVFLLACINVGTLLLARTNERLKDISIRVALGAPRTRLLLQTMGESIIISLTGGMLAVLLAGAGLELSNVFLSAVGEDDIPFWWNFHMDASTWIGAIGFVLVTILLTSAIPCWRLINGDFIGVMRDGTRGAVGLKPGRLSRALVVVSVTIITLLLYIGTVFSGELITLRKSISADNLDVANQVAANVRLDSERHSQAERLQFYQSLRSQLLGDPVVSGVLVRPSRSVVTVEKEVVAGDAGTAASRTTLYLILGSGSIDVINVRSVLEGRYLDEFDNNPNGPQIVVINRSLAESLWPNQSAIGQRLRLVDEQDSTENPWRQVVGVINDNAAAMTPLSRVTAEIHIPLSQAGSSPVLSRVEAGALVVQAKVSDQGGNSVQRNMERITTILGQAIQNFDADTEFELSIMADSRQGIERAMSFGINAAIACAVFSFLLAIAGIYGLMQSAVHLATQEIGTKRALGATDGRITRTFLFKGGKQVLSGFILAMLLASPFTYIIILSLGPEFLQPMILRTATVIAGLYVIILLAIYKPLRKVLMMEPGEALRHE